MYSTSIVTRNACLMLKITWKVMDGGVLRSFWKVRKLTVGLDGFDGFDGFAVVFCCCISFRLMWSNPLLACCPGQDLRKLISQCWHADVDRRPNFKVIAERLRELYSVEKHSSKLSMSALNLNEDEHPKLRGGGSLTGPV